jgi:hypothetical protein
MEGVWVGLESVQDIDIVNVGELSEGDFTASCEDQPLTPSSRETYSRGTRLGYRETVRRMGHQWHRQRRNHVQQGRTTRWDFARTTINVSRNSDATA